MSDAACNGLADVMFPPEDLSKAELEAAYDVAREICAACPASTECRRWALELPDVMTGGIIAGLCESQLKRARSSAVAIRKANRVPRCGTESAYDRHLKAGETCDYCWSEHARKNQRYAQAS